MEWLIIGGLLTVVAIGEGVSGSSRCGKASGSTSARIVVASAIELLSGVTGSAIVAAVVAATAVAVAVAVSPRHTA